MLSLPLLIPALLKRHPTFSCANAMHLRVFTRGQMRNE